MSAIETVGDISGITKGGAGRQVANRETAEGAMADGLGLQVVPKALQHVPGTLKILLTSGILPAAILPIVLNMVLPEELDS